MKLVRALVVLLFATRALADDSRFDELEKQFESSDAKARLAAIDGLASAQGKHWKKLRLRALGDKSATVRAHAAMQLQGETDIAKPVLEALDAETDNAARVAMIGALRHVRDDSTVAYLVKIIDRAETRPQVMAYLSRSKDSRGVEALIKAVRNHWDGAITALAATRDPRAIDVLVKLLGHPDRAVGLEAARGLVLLPDPDSTDPLVALAMKLDPSKRRDVTEALQAIARFDRTPCSVRKDGTVETSAYLDAILVEGCGTPVIGDILSLADTQLEALSGEGNLTDAFTADAQLTLVPGGLQNPRDLGLDWSQATVRNARTTISADHQTAWLWFDATVGGKPYRVTEIATKAKKKWRVAFGMWSQPKPMAVVTKGNLPALTELTELDEAPADVASALNALLVGNLDAAALERKTFMAYGTGDATANVTTFAKTWKTTWSKHLTALQPVRAGVNGGTAWIVADVQLDKPKKAPATLRLMVVLEKAVSSEDKADAWSVAHVHFASP